MFLQGRTRQRIVIIGETLSKVLNWSDRSTLVLLEMELAVSSKKRSEGDQKSFLSENLFTDEVAEVLVLNLYLGLSSPYSEEITDRRYLTWMDRQFLICNS